MKYFTACALLGAASADNLRMDKQQFVLMTEGFLKGALNAEGFDDIEKCIQDVETAVTDLEIVYTDFKDGGVSKIVDGLTHVADFIKTVKNGLSECSHIPADWEKLVKMAAIFESPASFAYAVGKHLLLDGVEIYGEISTAVHDYEAQDFSDFGFQIGEASAKLILGQTQPSEENLFLY